MKRLFIIFFCLFLFPVFLSHAEEAPPVVVGSGGSFTNLGNTGSASTQVPISVPPGRNGIAPNLNIVYNSSGGYGWLGLGWALEMGEISRATKRGTDYNGDDFVFLKDGSSSELVRRGDWGANCYGMKIEGAFSKFYRNPYTGGWEVTTKDGIKYYYGSSFSSRQINPYDTGNSNQVFKWYLDRVKDTNGNLMTISYVNDTGFVIMDRIDYTGNVDNAGAVRLSPSNYVKFNRSGSLLNSIDTYSNGQLAGKYALTYVETTSGSKRSLLSTITRYGSDGVTSMPPMAFSYQTAVNKFTTAGQPPPNIGPVAAFGDFNGDGRLDIVTTDISNRNVLVYLSNGNGFTSAGTWFTTSVPSVTVTDLIPGDFDGDGKADIIIKFKVDDLEASGAMFTALRQVERPSQIRCRCLRSCPCGQI